MTTSLVTSNANSQHSLAQAKKNGSAHDNLKRTLAAVVALGGRANHDQVHDYLTTVQNIVLPKSNITQHALSEATNLGLLKQDSNSLPNDVPKKTYWVTTGLEFDYRLEDSRWDTAKCLDSITNPTYGIATAADILADAIEDLGKQHGIDIERYRSHINRVHDFYRVDAVEIQKFSDGYQDRTSDLEYITARAKQLQALGH